MKHVNACTKKDFMSLPLRAWGEDIGPFDSLVILPTTTTHESGYRCMDFVAVKNSVPICRLSGCSDVIHIGGIGGFGRQNKGQETKAWSIDCLKKSGLLSVFCGSDELTAGLALSSFELFAQTRN